jgi:hypothetical protein
MNVCDIAELKDRLRDCENAHTPQSQLDEETKDVRALLILVARVLLDGAGERV